MKWTQEYVIPLAVGLLDIINKGFDPRVNDCIKWCVCEQMVCVLSKRGSLGEVSFEKSEKK